MSEEAPVEPTPTQIDMDAPKAYLEGVKVQVKKGGAPSGMHIQAKLAHYLALVVTGVVAIFVCAVLADGQSVIKLKAVKDLPRITDPALLDKGLDYRADELLGPTYGVGLHHDSAGYTWTYAGAGDTLQTYIDELGLYQVIAAVPSVVATDGLKHPVHFLSCHELKKAGLSAMGLGIIAEVAAALMVIFHGFTLLGLLEGKVSAKISKALSVLVWLTLTAGFLIVICLALAVFDTTWVCENDFVPTIRLAEHFNFQYGIGFGYAGYVCSLLVLIVMTLFTSTKPDETPATDMKKTVLKAVGMLTTGIVVLIVCSFTVSGANNAFVEKEVDPELNICEGQKPYHAAPGDYYFKNVDCMKDGLVQVLEQAGANVTKGYKGELEASSRVPILDHYEDTDLCPVNVHWHLGAEHLSVGEFDEYGSGPDTNGTYTEVGDKIAPDDYDVRRQLGGEDKPIRIGYRCHHYDAADPKFTTEYDWKFCTNTKVGETYEVHWPHSAAGACGTKWQYQTPFYDGVFCKDGIINILTPLNTYQKIGVQAQVFTIVNDEAYYNNNLFAGMIVDEITDKATDIAKYTGSTTGTSRDNDMCSRYAPITWQVDRKCHMISASSFDKMCEVMLQQADDMHGDIYPHGARELVDSAFVANNQQSRN